MQFEPIKQEYLKGIEMLNETSFPTLEQWSGDLLIPFLQREHGIVALIDDGVVGCILFRPKNHRLRVVSLAVMPQYRRMNIASTLLSQAFDKYPGTWDLHVRTTNTAAQMLYLKMGFEAIEIIDNYYGDEDAVLMLRLDKNIETESE